MLYPDDPYLLETSPSVTFSRLISPDPAQVREENTTKVPGNILPRIHHFLPSIYNNS